MKFENKLFLLRYTYLQNKTHRLCIVWQKARADKMSCKSQTLQENNHLSYHCESKSRKHQESLFHGRTLKKGICFLFFYPSTVVKIKACGRQQRRAKSQQQQIIPLGEKHFISRNSLLVLHGIRIECVIKIQSLKFGPGQVNSCQMLAI